ncbi:MAG: ribosome biogenesis GTP-binding protein YihA/YsxC [Bacteroidales bacterium]|jgi:GTP-binding protein|nr:ribosome biogenesis GTP-binding protein YihA/YsxC [Bacteroidales bacterium]
MLIKTADFVMANIDYKKCPQNDKFEFAFIGRSNVGKSSLINMLTNHKGLAKTSSQPGKTQKIIHFFINNSWYLVDLPGFGFAKISKTMRAEFSKMTKDYLLKRENLACVFLLIDSRIEPQKIDLEFMEWLGENRVPFVIVFTKTDKLKSLELPQKIEIYKKTLLETWETLPEIFITSAEKKIGTEELLDYIGKVMKIV